jgi:hypothetical protein
MKLRCDIVIVVVMYLKKLPSETLETVREKDSLSGLRINNCYNGKVILSDMK